MVEEEKMRNKSAEKRARQNVVRRERNRQTKSQVRTACKAFSAAVSAGKKEEAAEKLALAAKLLDAAVGKGALKRNTADRKKSRMARHYNKLAASVAAPAPAAN